MWQVVGGLWREGWCCMRLQLLGCEENAPKKRASRKNLARESRQACACLLVKCFWWCSQQPVPAPPPYLAP